MGVGRCGSTFVMNQLNRDCNTTIYGEDMGTTLSLLKTIDCLNEFLTHISNHPHIKKSIKTVADAKLQTQIAGVDYYIGNEMYHNCDAYETLNYKLIKTLTTYYNQQITGFKEIRWDMYENLNFLNILNKLYRTVKYIYLKRSDNEVLTSSMKNWSENEESIAKRIKSKKEKIETFLNTQTDINVIQGDITKDSYFIEQIKSFIKA